MESNTKGIEETQFLLFVFDRNIESQRCIGEVSSICKSYEIACKANSYVRVFGCVLRTRLTEEYLAVENIDLMEEQCFKYVCILILIARPD